MFVVTVTLAVAVLVWLTALACKLMYDAGYSNGYHDAYDAGHLAARVEAASTPTPR